MDSQLELEELIILHNTTGNSDKVYIVELVRHVNNNIRPSIDTFSVLVSWGRRTAPRLSTQIRVDNEPEWVAREEFSKVIRSKKKANYVDVGYDWSTATPGVAIPAYNRVDPQMPSAYSPNRSSSIVATRVSKPISLPSENSLTRGMQ
jgi:predicted DNA-binding WGR domain protein